MSKYNELLDIIEEAVIRENQGREIVAALCEGMLKALDAARKTEEAADTPDFLQIASAANKNIEKRGEK